MMGTLYETHKIAKQSLAWKSGVPTGIRTPVLAVKGRYPRPLDDGDAV